MRTSARIILLLLLLPFWPLPARVQPLRPTLQECVNATITSPRDGAVLRGRVEIFGSASISQFQFYKIEFAPSFNPDQWAALPGSTTYAQPVIDGRLDVFDTTKVPDGTYSLKLTVVDVRAQEVCRAFVRNILIANTTPLTPTSEPTEEATPTRPPQAPPITSPTIIAIVQPPTATPPAPIATAAPAIVPTRPPSILPDTQEITGLFNLRKLGEAFMLGVGSTTAVFVLVGLIVLIRRLL
jgi:hypothetical protein